MPWKKNESPTPEAADAAAGDATAAEPAGHVPTAEETKAAAKGSAYTPKKGRPTPTRAEAERERGIHRGPINPPLTSKEARERRREEKAAMKASMSKEELKRAKAEQRAERREARRIADERMAAGDPKYMLPRDQGPDRALVRDWVDTRRFLANIFLPFALVLLFIMLIGQANQTIANVASLIAMVLIIVLFIEGIIIGRRANALVRERFPESKTGFGIGFYAYSRATQPRRLRTPRPRKEIGDEV